MYGRLPPATTHRIRIERGLRARMDDGVELVADRLVPVGGDKLPIVLIRSPYGRTGFIELLATVFAERGYQTVLQSCRGTGGSGGTLDPLRNEGSDGRQTLAWLAEQPWFGGSVVTAGLSYLGFVQWALAPGAPPYLKAIAPQVSSSELRSAIYPGDTFAFGPNLRTAVKLHYHPSRLQALLERLPGRDPEERAHRTLPLGDADVVATGGRVAFFHDWLEHREPGDPFWDAVDFSGQVADVTAAVTLVAGWYDVFLPRLIDDYVALREAGRRVRLTLGPWTHTQPAGFFLGVRETLAWFDLQTRGQPVPDGRTAPVRIFVMGENAWRDLVDWPPPSTPTRWYAQPGGALREGAPPVAGSEPDRYRYDPADPTPFVGGNTLGKGAGAKDNRRFETRSDVLVYTTDGLERDLEVIGQVSAEIHVRSSRPDTDLFVRLCDVFPDGRSINVTDGPVRVNATLHPQGPDRVTCVEVRLWPTGYLFKRGHRVRLQVSSGATPRISPNLGNGERLETATTPYIADQEIFHDRNHPTAIVLPVTARG